MRIGFSAQLQAFLYATLQNDATLTQKLNGHIFDAPPPGPLPFTYITLGPEKVTDASDMTAKASVHEVAISVVTTQTGFASIKELSDLIIERLDHKTTSFSQGAITSMQFLRSEAAREADGTIRRVDLVFRARIDAQ